MKHLRAFAFALGLIAAPAAAQVPSWPQTLPSNTVVGRLGIGPGPAQAIPFATFQKQLATAGQNLVYAGPASGGTGSVSFRALVGADLPLPSTSSLGGIQSASCTSGSWISSISTSGIPSCTAPSPTSSTTMTFDTVAALNAATIGGSVTSVTTLGYYARGDGGGATYVLVASAPSLPCYQTSNAGGVYWDLQSRDVTNVKWCGAKGDSATNDSTAFANAVTSAYSVHGTVYVPAVSGYYLADINLQDIGGLSIVGDAKGSGSGAAAGGSKIVSPDNATTLNIFSNVVSGTCNNVTVKNLKLISAGTAVVFYLKNCLWVKVDNVFVSGYNGTSIQGTGNFVITDLESYASNTALQIGNGNNTLTNSGPGSIIGGQFQGTGQAINVFGDALGISFYNVMYASPGGNPAIKIDGTGSGTPKGDLAFYNLHGESNYPTAPNSGSDIIIGQVNKFGHVAFYGGNAWGQGSGTNYHAYWLQADQVASLEVIGFTVSKLGNAHGFDIAMIYLASTCGCNFRFMNLNKDDILGSYYSDARTGAPLSSWVLDATNHGSLDGNYTVANLPACSSSLLGLRAIVTDASSPTYNGTVTGGSTTKTAVMCNGTSWIAN